MGRIVAIDYGRKRTGLAVTDPLQMIAGALDTVPTHTLMDFLKKYLSANGVETVVVGMPRQMDGTPSESYTYIRPFVTRLQKEFPDLRIEIAGPPVRLYSNFIRGIRSLPVVIGN